MIRSMQKVTGNIMNVAGLKHNDISAKTEEHKKEMELFRKKVESELFSQSLKVSRNPFCSRNSYIYDGLSL